MTGKRYLYVTRFHDTAHVSVYADEPPRPEQERAMAVLYKTELAGEMREWRLDRLRAWYVANAEAGTLAASNMVPPPRKPAERGTILGTWKHRLYPEFFDEDGKRREPAT